MDITDSGCDSITDMVPGSSPVLDAIMALGDRSGHSDWHVPDGSVTLGHQQYLHVHTKYLVKKEKVDDFWL